jgi:hypothetical protein
VEEKVITRQIRTKSLDYTPKSLTMSM